MAVFKYLTVRVRSGITAKTVPHIPAKTLTPGDVNVKRIHRRDMQQFIRVWRCALPIVSSPPAVDTVGRWVAVSGSRTQSRLGIEGCYVAVLFLLPCDRDQIFLGITVANLLKLNMEQRGGYRNVWISAQSTLGSIDPAI